MVAISELVRKSFGGRTFGQNNEYTLGCAVTATQSEFNRSQRLGIYLSTALRLGIANVGRALMHRACKRMGIYQSLLPQEKAEALEIRFDSSSGVIRPEAPSPDRSILIEAEEWLRGIGKYFSAHTHHIGNPPDWFLNPFQRKRHPYLAVHWSKIPEFSADAGDIKVVWELSRFTWALVFARAWRISGDARYLATLQLWVQDWWQRNPPNTGPNWMCGQETSIRLISFLVALRIAGWEENVGPGLTTFVEAHCKRIYRTTFYAIAQDNNHGTSEAAGLFVGGSWLARNGEGEAKIRGHKWAVKGRKLLEGLVSRLILPDGSFSQYSLTYHRLMLDTLSVVEAWRRQAGEPSFTKEFYVQAAAGTRWLAAMIDPQTGDGPNLGGNDGSHVYRLDTSAYRDFRPCLQLASFLFLSRPALESGPWDEPAAWLGVSVAELGRPWLSDLGTAVFPHGGYVVMRNRTGARAFIRAPAARFRPAHADALHVDLWWKGRNLLRDGGTYSYANGAVAEVLSSVTGHNTQEFDGHNQMPRLARFLYGGWVRVVGTPAITATAGEQSWTGEYADSWGAEHRRTVTLTDDTLSVRDEIRRFKRKAVMRWHLAPANWTKDERGCASTMARIIVESSTPIRRLSLESGWESRHYLEKSSVPVLEVEINQSPAVLTTTAILT